MRISPAANNVKQALQVFRASGNNRNLVEPYGHDDDEYDGECAIAGTLQAGKGGEVSRAMPKANIATTSATTSATSAETCALPLRPPA